MTVFKKAVSLILVFILSVSIAVPVSAKQKKLPENPGEYTEMLLDEGYAALSADIVVDVLQQISRVMSLFTFGKKEVGALDVKFDRFSSDVFLYILEESGFDVQQILENIPDIFVPTDIAMEALKIDTTAFREEMYRRRDESNNKGDGTTALVYHILGAYFGVIKECYVFAEETETKDIYELFVKFIYKDGTSETVAPGIIINVKTGECTNKDDSGMLGIGFNFSLSEMVLYATVNCWMREVGFCLLYDVVAQMMPVVYKYDTRRIDFEYNDLQWRIQFWKGNYFVANGGEVGLYYRTPQKYGSFYKCADDEKMLPMALKISCGEKVLLNKTLQDHWWINGFNMSGKMYPPEALTLEYRVIMPDEEMRDAFCEALDNCRQKDLSYTVDGLEVMVLW